MFDKRLKITLTKSSASPLKKTTLLSLFTPPLKIQKSASPPFFANTENFSGHTAERGEDTMN